MRTGEWMRRRLARLRFRKSVIAAVLWAAAGTASAAEDQSGNSQPERDRPFPSLMKLSGGLFGDIVADRESAGLFGFEYRAGPELELLRIRPSIGGMVTMDASRYGWLGLNYDLALGPLVLTLSTTAGIYGSGDGQDLGSPFVARNGGEIAWRFDNEIRLGVAMHYYSNYGAGSTDPGIASLTLVYSHPLRTLAR